MTKNSRSEAADNAHPKGAATKKSPASEHDIAREGGGKFAKGKSGNPGGRPKEVAEVRDLARQYTTQAIETLVRVMAGEDKAAVAAANAILDRGWGKAPATMELTGKNGAPIAPVLNVTYGGA